MKPCRYCAEEIQDAAIVCRFCNRNQAAPLPRKESSGLAWVIALVLAGALVTSIVFYVNNPFAASSAAASSLASETPADSVLPPPLPPPPPPPPPPAYVAVVDTSAVEIRAGYAEYFDFSLSDPRTCILTGRVIGLAGGKRDFNVFVFDDDGFTNWSNGNQAHTYFNESQTSAVTLNVVLPSPGSYHLVVSNRFSVFTPKAVQIRNAQVTCS